MCCLQLKNAFKVAWADPSDPTKGYKYLYLTPKDYAELCKTKSVIAEPRNVDGEERYVITDIIGAGEDLGVENLKGSGAIAGEVRVQCVGSFWC